MRSFDKFTPIELNRSWNWVPILQRALPRWPQSSLTFLKRALGYFLLVHAVWLIISLYAILFQNFTLYNMRTQACVFTDKINIAGYWYSFGYIGILYNSCTDLYMCLDGVILPSTRIKVSSTSDGSPGLISLLLVSPALAGQEREWRLQLLISALLLYSWIMATERELAVGDLCSYE